MRKLFKSILHEMPLEALVESFIIQVQGCGILTRKKNISHRLPENQPRLRLSN